MNKSLQYGIKKNISVPYNPPAVIINDDCRLSASMLVKKKGFTGTIPDANKGYNPETGQGFKTLPKELWTKDDYIQEESQSKRQKNGKTLTRKKQQ